MGLRTWLKRALRSVVGDAFYEELRKSSRKGHERGLYGADGKPPLPAGVKDETLKQSIEESLSASQTKNTAPISIPAPPPPVIEKKDEPIAAWDKPLSSYRERYTGKQDASSDLKGDDLTKFLIDKSQKESQDKNTTSVSLPMTTPPVVKEEIKDAEDVPQENEETFDTSTLSCEMREVSVDAVIDYTDKHGNETRREITTEEIYDYEDGVVVIRAFCHARRDYRTFVSKRIRYWIEPNSGRPIEVDKLSEYLIKASKKDIPNLALNIAAAASSEINLFKFYIGKYTQYYRISDKGVMRYEVTMPQSIELARYITNNQSIGNGGFREEISQLGSTDLVAFTNELSDYISNKQVGDAPGIISKRVLASKSLARRKRFVDLVEKLTEDLPCASSISQVMRDDLLDPSFRIDFKEFATELSKNQTQTVEDIKEQSEDAERELAIISESEPAKSKQRSKKHRKSAELNVIRNIARNECQIQLLKNLSEGKMVFERQPFEQEVRRRVCEILSEEEIAKYGDMMLPYLGNGIQFGYLVTGLKKKNRGWYPNEKGVVVIDLNNIEKD